MFVMICAVMFAFVVWMLLHLFSRLIVSWLDNSHSSDISAADISMDEDAD